MVPQDQQLVDQAREGSKTARDELVRRFSDSLQSYLRREIGPRLARAASISDLSQESFLRSLDALQVLPADASLADYEALLFQHARWLVLKEVRKHRRFAGESALDRPLPDLGRSAGDRTGPVTEQDEREWLERSIAALDGQSARVVRLRIEGLTFGQIGEEMGLGEDAVRKRYLRAAMELRRRNRSQDG